MLVHRQEDAEPVLITCSSDGGVKFWALSLLEKTTTKDSSAAADKESSPLDIHFELKYSHSVDARITCVSLSTL